MFLFFYFNIYLAVLGLSCSMQDLLFIAAFELLVVACRVYLVL